MRLGYIASLSTALVRKVIPQLRDKSLDRLVVGSLVPPSRTFDRDAETVCDMRSRLRIPGLDIAQKRGREQVQRAQEAFQGAFGRFIYVPDTRDYGGKAHSDVRGVQMPYSHVPAARVGKEILLTADDPQRRLHAGDGAERDFSMALGAYTGVRVVFMPGEAPPDVYSRSAKAAVASRKLQQGAPYSVDTGTHLFRGGIVDEEVLRHGRAILPSYFVLDKSARAVTFYRFEL